MIRVCVCILSRNEYVLKCRQNHRFRYVSTRQTKGETRRVISCCVSVLYQEIPRKKNLDKRLRYVVK